jgi:hypothetical protein
MAINRSKDKPEALSIPEKLRRMLKGGFTASVMEKKYKELGKGLRSDIKNYLESNDDDFTVDASKSWKCEFGSVNVKVRKNFDIDNDGLLAKVKAGKVTVETLLSIAKFSATDLTKMGLDDCCTETDPTEFLELRPNAEFKESFESEGEKPAKPKAKKKSKTKSKDPSEELAAILGEE